MAYERLHEELEIWHQQKIEPLIFYRDDDVTTLTPNLLRLVRLLERRNVPAMLSVIPAFADENLGELVRDSQLLTAAVHGYSHKNFADIGFPKNEFPDTRPLPLMMEELKIALWKCSRLFKENFCPLFVPPWHNISNNLEKKVLYCGYAGISKFNIIDEKNKFEINPSIDLINWDSKKFKPLDVIFDEISNNFRIKRKMKSNYIGIMGHSSIYHKYDYWKIDNIIEMTTNYGCKWIKMDNLIGNTSKNGRKK